MDVVFFFTCKKMSLYKVHIVATVKTFSCFYIIIMCLCERLITSQKIAAIMGDKERYTLFYGIQSPFSQFHPSKFTIGGVMYKCAEQYMMYCKAITFKNYITAQKLWR